MINGNDGGVDISTDGGETWFAPPLPIGQLYHVSVDGRVPFQVAGSLQDIGTAQGPSDILADSGIRDTDWHDVGGGEAGWVVSDPGDPDVVYAGEYGGEITRYDHSTGEIRHVSIYPDDSSGHGAEDLRYRFQWTAPIAVSPHPTLRRLPRRQRALPLHRRRRQLDRDQPRPHPQRQVEAAVVGRPDHRRQHRGRGLRHDLRRRRVAGREGGDLGRLATTAWCT